MERLLSMLGAEDPTQKSKEIIELETRLANVSQLCVHVHACFVGMPVKCLLSFRSLYQNMMTKERT